MTFSTSRLAAGNLAAVAAAAVLLAGCGVHQPDDAAPLPPPAADAYPPAPPADLAGAPPAAAYPLAPDGLAGAPPSADPVPAMVAMAPIANPEDMSAAERHRIYGDRYDRRAAHRRATAHGAVQAAPAPAAKPARAPAGRPHPAPAAHVAPLDPRTAQLQTALVVPVVSASSLTAAPAIAQGRPGQVALSLPQNLLDLIRQQAAKVGLARAARSAQVTATLSGQGYDIAPSAAQTAPVTSMAPHFLWSVAPRPGVAHSRLHADVQATLTGEGKPRTFPLASFEQPGLPDEPRAAPSGAGKLGFGGLKGSTRTLLGAAQVLGALILMLVFANRAMASQARARRRRALEAREARVREAEAASPSQAGEPAPKVEPSESEKA
jgi:hypothetical protein